jgi:hypothetical protein
MSFVLTIQQLQPLFLIQGHGKAIPKALEFSFQFFVGHDAATRRAWGQPSLRICGSRSPILIFCCATLQLSTRERTFKPWDYAPDYSLDVAPGLVTVADVTHPHPAGRE